MKHPRAVHQPRYFDREHSSSSHGHDHTSSDGSGLVPDDGQQRSERDYETNPSSNNNSRKGY
jgi:hypothetical protein